MWDRDFMARQFGKSWYRIEAKNRRFCRECATIVPRLLRLQPVDKLRIADSNVIVLIRTNPRDLCQECTKLREEFGNLEPHFEVVRNPFQKGGYIAQMSLPGIAVSEEIPIEKLNDDDDREDMGLFWSLVRKKLTRRLRDLNAQYSKIA